MTGAAQRFETALLAMDRLAAGRILSDAIREGPGSHVVEAVVVPALEAIGEGWSRGSVSLAQIYMAGRICEQAVEAILPAPVPSADAAPPCAVVTLEDFHTLGKRIVLAAVRAAGIRTLDYGRLTVEEVLPRIAEDRLSVLFVSVLMLPSALRVRDLVSSIRERRLPVRVVVGGAPFRLDKQLWREVGADATGNSAIDAVRVARAFQDGAA